jgi:hypothetical protein
MIHVLICVQAVNTNVFVEIFSTYVATDKLLKQQNNVDWSRTCPNIDAI